jgi:hypothetical protein
VTVEKSADGASVRFTFSVPAEGVQRASVIRELMQEKASAVEFSSLSVLEWLGSALVPKHDTFLHEAAGTGANQLCVRGQAFSQSEG